MTIRKNDQVIVTTGRSKGKSGKVIAILAGGKALVEKLNMVKRHRRPTPKMPQGGILEKEAPIDISNLMLYCLKCARGVRAGIRAESNGTKKRVCKKCGETLGS